MHAKTSEKNQTLLNKDIERAIAAGLAIRIADESIKTLNFERIQLSAGPLECAEKLRKSLSRINIYGLRVHENLILGTGEIFIVFLHVDEVEVSNSFLESKESLSALSMECNLQCETLQDNAKSKILVPIEKLIPSAARRALLHSLSDMRKNGLIATALFNEQEQKMAMPEKSHLATPYAEDTVMIIKDRAVLGVNLEARGKHSIRIGPDFWVYTNEEELVVRKWFATRHWVSGKIIKIGPKWFFEAGDSFKCSEVPEKLI